MRLAISQTHRSRVELFRFAWRGRQAGFAVANPPAESIMPREGTGAHGRRLAAGCRRHSGENGPRRWNGSKRRRGSSESEDHSDQWRDGAHSTLAATLDDTAQRQGTRVLRISRRAARMTHFDCESGINHRRTGSGAGGMVPEGRTSSDGSTARQDASASRNSDTLDGKEHEDQSGQQVIASAVWCRRTGR
jgi:hypothetical protein